MWCAFGFLGEQGDNVSKSNSFQKSFFELFYGLSCEFYDQEDNPHAPWYAHEEPCPYQDDRQLSWTYVTFNEKQKPPLAALFATGAHCLKALGINEFTGCYFELDNLDKPDLGDPIKYDKTTRSSINFSRLVPQKASNEKLLFPDLRGAAYLHQLVELGGRTVRMELSIFSPFIKDISTYKNFYSVLETLLSYETHFSLEPAQEPDSSIHNSVYNRGSANTLGHKFVVTGPSWDPVSCGHLLRIVWQSLAGVGLSSPVRVELGLQKDIEYIATDR